MTPQEFEEALARGYELRGVEFKGHGLRSDAQLFRKVVRAILGMANRRDGGVVIVGVDDSNGVVTPTGLSSAELATWTYDDILAGVSEYADPYVELEVEKIVHQGKNFVAISVAEFAEIPVLCRKDYPGVLRAGACYVRSRRKSETAEIPTHADMRDLLEVAVEKGLQRYFRQAQAVRSLQVDAETQFREQLAGVK